MTDVGSYSNLAEGVPTITKVSGREIVIIRWRGRVHAVRDVCPHQSHSFVNGRVQSRIVSSGVPGHVDVRSNQPVLICPWHAWTFALDDGRCTHDPRQRIRRYEVVIENDRVLVESAVS